MVINANIKQNWNDIYNQVVILKHYASFASKWKNHKYTITSIGDHLYLTFNDIYIYDAPFECQHNFKLFYNQCKKIIKEIENLKEKKCQREQTKKTN